MDAPVGAPPPFDFWRRIFVVAWLLAKLGRSRVARTNFLFVIAGPDPAIHAEGSLVQIRGTVSLVATQYGPRVKPGVTGIRW
jgi:hypothetical protein